MPFGAILIGSKELERKFASLPDKLRRKALRKGVTKVAQLVTKRAKQFAERSKETGLLKSSLGRKVFTWKNKQGVGAVIGARKGFKRAVVRGRSKLKKLSKKKGVELSARGGKVKFRNPVNYLHLVELGTAHSPAKPILRPALDATRSVVVATIGSEIRKQIEAERPNN